VKGRAAVDDHEAGEVARWWWGGGVQYGEVSWAGLRNREIEPSPEDSDNCDLFKTF
jgi:hypothetical protein